MISNRNDDVGTLRAVVATGGWHALTSVVVVVVVVMTIAGLGRPREAGAAEPEGRWQEGDGHRFLELPSSSASGAGAPGFNRKPADVTGIAFTNLLTVERGLTNQIFMSGSGVACGDVDGDGRADVYFCGLDAPNRLYRNLGGWRFEDVTAEAGVACAEGASTGAALADVDGDGDLDLFVTGLGRGVRLFRNDGRGRFVDGTAAAGLRSQAGSMTVALADVEGDGDLDLYVANYRSSTFHDLPAVRFRVATLNGQRRISMVDDRPPTAEELVRYSVSPSGNQILENGEADGLYLNDGRGRFTAVSWTDGTFLDEAGRPLAAPPHDWGYTAMFRDMNGDGLPDLYVCNDNESPDRCWINQGGGTFRALGTGAWRQTSLSSMGVDFADLDRDGRDEFFVADMLSRGHGLRHQQMIDRRPPHPVGGAELRPAYQRNTLFLNRGDGTYAEIAQLAGVDATDWSWSPVFLDVDLDGYEDLLITTGLERSLRDADARRYLDREKAQRRLGVREFQELRRVMPRLDLPNHAYRNRGDLTFVETSAAWGFDSLLNSQGMALADLDGDGDLDVVVNVLNGPALVYENRAVAPRVAVRLRGLAPNTRGIGARVRVRGGPVVQSQEMMAGGRYLSGDEALRVFAAGPGTNRLTLEVIWRSGRRSVVTNAVAQRLYEVIEPATGLVGTAPGTSPLAAPASSSARAWFADVSDRLGHRHVETAFNDHERQLLLSRRLSQAGPGVSWGDLNQDGRDDLVVGTGRGGSLGVFVGNGRGGFERVDVTELTGPIAGDTAGVVAVPVGLGTQLFVGVSHHETGGTNLPSVLRLEVGTNGVSVLPGLPSISSSAGPLAMADLDGDGVLELFVGGSSVPGRHPEPATSRLFRRAAAATSATGVSGAGALGWALDERHRAMLEGVGLVQGATFSDLDGDGFPELLLACEWGPIRIFRNRRGQLEPWDPVVRISREAGGVGLGRPWNTNGEVALARLSGWTGWWNSVATGDFDGDGRMDVVAGNWGWNTRQRAYLAKPLRIYHGDLRGDGRVEGIEAWFDPGMGAYVPVRYWDMMSRVMPSMQERLSGAGAYSRAGLDEVLGELKPLLRMEEAAVLDSVVMLNRGDHFEIRPLPLAAQLSPIFGLAAADFDGDGRLDLAAAQNFFAVDAETSRHDAGRALILRGDGRGGFEPLTAGESGVDVPGEQRGAAVSDFDGDGRVDVVVTQNGGETRLYRNERGRPGLRVRLDAGLTSGNRAGVGAVVRRVVDGREGPAWEVRAGSGYWSQDSAVLVLASGAPGASGSTVTVRWPGGRSTAHAVAEGVAEVVLKPDGGTVRVR